MGIDEFFLAIFGGFLGGEDTVLAQQETEGKIVQRFRVEIGNIAYRMAQGTDRDADGRLIFFHDMFVDLLKHPLQSPHAHALFPGHAHAPQAFPHFQQQMLAIIF